MKIFLWSLAAYAWLGISIFAASFTVPLPPGLTALANPLNNSSNTPEVLFPDADGSRDGDFLFFATCSGGYQTLVFDSESPTVFSNENGDIATMAEIPILAPGRGFYYLNTQGMPESVTFTGAAPTAVYPSPYSCGCGEYSFLGAQNTNSSSYQDYVATGHKTVLKYGFIS